MTRSQLNLQELRSDTARNLVLLREKLISLKTITGDLIANTAALCFRRKAERILSGEIFIPTGTRNRMPTQLVFLLASHVSF